VPTLLDQRRQQRVREHIVKTLELEEATLRERAADTERQLDASLVSLREKNVDPEEWDSQVALDPRVVEAEQKEQEVRSRVEALRRKLTQLTPPPTDSTGTASMPPSSASTVTASAPPSTPPSTGNLTSPGSSDAGASKPKKPRKPKKKQRQGGAVENRMDPLNALLADLAEKAPDLGKKAPSAGGSPAIEETEPAPLPNLTTYGFARGTAWKPGMQEAYLPGVHSFHPLKSQKGSMRRFVVYRHSGASLERRKPFVGDHAASLEGGLVMKVEDDASSPKYQVRPALAQRIVDGRAVAREDWNQFRLVRKGDLRPNCVVVETDDGAILQGVISYLNYFVPTNNAVSDYAQGRDVHGHRQSGVLRFVGKPLKEPGDGWDPTSGDYIGELALATIAKTKAKQAKPLTTPVNIFSPSWEWEDKRGNRVDGQPPPPIQWDPTKPRGWGWVESDHPSAPPDSWWREQWPQLTRSSRPLANVDGSGEAPAIWYLTMDSIKAAKEPLKKVREIYGDTLANPILLVILALGLPRTRIPSAHRYAIDNRADMLFMANLFSAPVSTILELVFLPNEDGPAGEGPDGGDDDDEHRGGRRGGFVWADCEEDEDDWAQQGYPQPGSSSGAGGSGLGRRDTGGAPGKFGFQRQVGYILQ